MDVTGGVTHVSASHGLAPEAISLASASVTTWHSQNRCKQRISDVLIQWRDCIMKSSDMKHAVEDPSSKE
jgi:hypothetical protein